MFHRRPRGSPSARRSGRSSCSTSCSLDSIITAVGMTDDLPIMVIAVVVAVMLMLVAATPIAEFIGRNPTVVMLALAFLLVIGMAPIADGFGMHVPKGYIYAAMAFSALVETLNLLSAGRGTRRPRPPRSGEQERSRPRRIAARGGRPRAEARALIRVSAASGGRGFRSSSGDGDRRGASRAARVPAGGRPRARPRAAPSRSRGPDQSSSRSRSPS